MRRQQYPPSAPAIARPQNGCQMQLFAQILDGAYGKPAAGVLASLSRAVGDSWEPVAIAETDRTGQIADWDLSHFSRGLYQITFDSDGYFSQLGFSTAYTKVVLILRIEPSADAFKVQVTLSPYSYSTFFGKLDE